ncbi:MAG: enoyl-CoA hydratase [Burkholderiales bacterium]|nr:MAG: enoyl-CoA hydratase [Burkholderiales bacterium]
MRESVRLERDGAVAAIVLHRPQALNALDGEMMAQLRFAAEQVEADASVRAVVIRGEGPAFLAGGDVKLFHRRIQELPALILAVGPDLNAAVLALRRMGKPVLASVHGAVAGAGVSLVAAADLAIAADDARFTLAYSRIGACPDGGATYCLPRLVGEKKALELMFLSEAFDAATAKALGLVNWVVPAATLQAKTREIAARLAEGPSFAYGETKALVYGLQDGALARRMEEENRAFARCAATADMAEGVAAFVEKRAPRFVGE